MLTDPIADMLTRIRNANKTKEERVFMDSSTEKLAIAKILVKEGYVADAKVDGLKGNKKVLTIVLKYSKEGERVISDLKRISKPGLRVYADVDEIPQVLNGLGIAIVSTSAGIMTDAEARKANVGGEVLAYVW
jgi:small subunit ribosomal protein S8